jgi:hypothetical protein
MKLKQTICWGISTVAVALGSAAIAQADPLAGCNYTFSVGQYEDRGIVQIVKTPASVLMRIIEDDDTTQFDHVHLSSASGDQARALMKSDANFQEFAARARIFPDDVERVDEYVVTSQAPQASSQTPQASFFAFYGKDNRYLGGFGIHGQTSYVCDWV